MGQTKYQVTLAVDGKHAVSVQSDDPSAVTEALIWAQETYKKLVRLRNADETRASRQTFDRVERVNGAEPDISRVDVETEAPICAIHDVTMIWQKGRKGYFWSCHEKNEDESWCDWRPGREV